MFSKEAKRGLLLDTTRCIGCGACGLACKERNHLPKTSDDPRRDALSDSTYTALVPSAGRYVRKMCMHCVEPTCVASCPVKALEKRSNGPVVYIEERCIGCRYCMQACPFSVPRYEWSRVLPQVRKCSFCADRQGSGLPTACATVCPTGATTYGDRNDLILEARKRIKESPSRYYDHVYGLEEVGGTSVLLISDLPPEALGLPTGLTEEAIPLLTWRVLSQVPKFAVAAAVGLAGVWWITGRREDVEHAEHGGPHDGEKS